MLALRYLNRCWPKVRCSRRLVTDARQSDAPLRILFCGSDDFSVASLRALYKYSREADSNILSIDVAAKKGKPSGRGLKKLKAPLIKSVADELNLPLHQFNTFTGWTPPEFPQTKVTSINLIIAVSFGLLIPARIINGATFGGLNVHPSLLPDLRGAAPLNWAIIKGYTHTGVSIQTLHPTRFDEGVILAQSKQIAIGEKAYVNELRQITSPIGAELLVQAIKDKKYLKPHAAVGGLQHMDLQQAPKIKTADKILNPETDDLQTILRRNRAVPKLFAFALTKKDDKGHDKVRIIFGTSMREAPPGYISADIISTIGVGRPFVLTKHDQAPSAEPGSIFMICKDEKVLEIPLLLVEGRKEGPASQVAAAGSLLQPPIEVCGLDVHPFLGLHYH